jgi:hypothetical protein
MLLNNPFSFDYQSTKDFMAYNFTIFILEKIKILKKDKAETGSRN